MLRYILFALLLVPDILSGQSNETLRIRQFRKSNEDAIIKEFTSFLSIPNTAADTGNSSKNAAYIIEMMRRRGIENTRLLTTSTSVPPVVFGEVKVPGALHTIIFYAHYDGQPVNPSQWAKGLMPFIPALFTDELSKGSPISFPSDGRYDPDWRIYGRGASDDKAGIASILNAYDALVKSGSKLNNNIKFFFEGEEEAGSPHLPEILGKYRSLLASDVWIICDGPVHQTGKKLVALGVRGDTHLDLTVYASKRPLHSGHYGNWAPNPAMMLVKLLASMKDDNGKVTIKGFYDDVKPLSTSERKALNEVPPVDNQMKEELGIIKTEMNIPLVEAINLPSLNINGIQSANVGKQSANVIPTTATAVIDLRLVLGNDWAKQQQKVIDHIKSKGFTVIDHEPTEEERKKFPKLIKVIRGTDGYNAQRTSMDLPIIMKVISTVKSTTSDHVVILPTLGGSLPLFVFEKYLDAKTITVPIANHDNNQHAENENIRIRNLWDGIETMAALMQIK